MFESRLNEVFPSLVEPTSFPLTSCFATSLVKRCFPVNPEPEQQLAVIIPVLYFGFCSLKFAPRHSSQSFVQSFGHFDDRLKRSSKSL